MDLLTTYIHHHTRNYSTTTNLHIPQITTAPAKPFPACYVFYYQANIPQLNSLNSPETGLGPSLYSPGADPAENTALTVPL
jgi:hypothetical protein